MLYRLLSLLAALRLRGLYLCGKSNAASSRFSVSGGRAWTSSPVWCPVCTDLLLSTQRGALALRRNVRPSCFLQTKVPRLVFSLCLGRIYGPSCARCPFIKAGGVRVRVHCSGSILGESQCFMSVCGALIYNAYPSAPSSPRLHPSPHQSYCEAEKRPASTHQAPHTSSYSADSPYAAATTVALGVSS